MKWVWLLILIWLGIKVLDIVWTMIWESGGDFLDWTAKKVDINAGWARFAGHFILYGTVPALTGFVAYRLGYRLPELLLFWSFIAVLTVVLILELRSYRKGAQTKGKTVVDIIAKIGGFAAGIFTANGW